MVARGTGAGAPVPRCRWPRRRTRRSSSSASSRWSRPPKASWVQPESAGAWMTGSAAPTVSAPTPRTAAATARSGPTMAAVAPRSCATSPAVWRKRALLVAKSNPTMRGRQAVDDNVTAVELAVRDPCAVQGAQLRPHRVEQGVGERVGIEVVQLGAGHLLHDEERERSADPGDDHPRRLDAGVAGQQRQVRLVLHLRASARHERRRRVAEREVSPRARQQLGVGLVTTEGDDAERRVAALRDEHGAADGLLAWPGARRSQRRRARPAPARPGAPTADRPGCRTRTRPRGPRPTRGRWRPRGRWGSRGRGRGSRAPAAATSDCPKRRVGRARCGDATSTVATATERRTIGNRGAPVRSNVTSNAFHRPLSCTRNAISRPRTHAPPAATARSRARRQRRRSRTVTTSSPTAQSAASW